MPRRRTLMLMTEVFVDLDDEHFEKEWVQELIDQVVLSEDKFLSVGQLAKALTDVRTRYRLMMKTSRAKADLNPMQVRIIRRLRGIVNQNSVARYFGTTQSQISDIQRRPGRYRTK